MTCKVSLQTTHSARVHYAVFEAYWFVWSPRCMRDIEIGVKQQQTHWLWWTGRRSTMTLLRPWWCLWLMEALEIVLCLQRDPSWSSCRECRRSWPFMTTSPLILGLAEVESSCWCLYIPLLPVSSSNLYSQGKQQFFILYDFFFGKNLAHIWLSLTSNL